MFKGAKAGDARHETREISSEIQVTRAVHTEGIMVLE